MELLYLQFELLLFTVYIKLFTNVIRLRFTAFLICDYEMQFIIQTVAYYFKNCLAIILLYENI